MKIADDMTEHTYLRWPMACFGAAAYEAGGLCAGATVFGVGGGG